MSNINPQNIDGTYPIAGQDNDSQGFRDNFTNTINNFTFAAAELTDLQTYALLRAPLGSVGQTGTPTNDMNYAFLTAPQVIKVVETTNAIGNVASGGSQTIDWAAGHYQTVGVTEVASLSFASTWPVNGVWTKLRLRIRSYGPTALTFGSNVTDNLNKIKGYSSGTTIQLDDGVHEFEFSTADNGTTVTILDLRDNYGPVVQYYTPTGNATLTANAGVSTFFVAPTYVGAVGVTVQLPNTRVQGTTIVLTSNVAIANLQVSPGWTSSVSPSANIALSLNSSVEYTYIANKDTWYKIR